MVNEEHKQSAVIGTMWIGRRAGGGGDGRKVVKVRKGRSLVSG